MGAPTTTHFSLCSMTGHVVEVQEISKFVVCRLGFVFGLDMFRK
jgi:hypothetical protein